MIWDLSLILPCPVHHPKNFWQEIQQREEGTGQIPPPIFFLKQPTKIFIYPSSWHKKENKVNYRSSCLREKGSNFHRVVFPGDALSVGFSVVVVLPGEVLAFLPVCVLSQVQTSPLILTGSPFLKKTEPLTFCFHLREYDLR